MTGRDNNATWRWLDDACRAPGWSEGAIEDGIEQGYLRFRGYVQGVGGVSSDTLEADWTLAKMSADDRKLSVFWLDGKLDTVIIQNVEVLLPDAPKPPTASPSAQWAITATRNLRAENKIPEGMTKAELARLLETEAQKDVRAGKIRRELKASYLENQLDPWGIWPLISFK